MIIGNQLRISGKTYMLTQIASVQAMSQRRKREDAPVTMLAACGALLMLYPFSGFVGHKHLSREGWIVGFIAISLLLASLILYLVNGPRRIHLAIITTSAGDRDQLAFPTADACQQFCDQLSAAIAATGASVNVDARAVHLHIPAQEKARSIDRA